MDITFSALQYRIYSTPVTKYGKVIPPKPTEFTNAIYDGRLLPAFLLENGGDYQNVAEFLRVNRLGSVFDLEEGQSVKVPRRNKDKFSVHPDS